MFVYEEQKIIFHHIPKTAGKSIRKYFQDICHFKMVSVGKQHTPLKYCYSKKYEDYNILTVIRNPYKRLVSYYIFGKNKFKNGNYSKNNIEQPKAAYDMNFDEWIQTWVIPKSQSKTWHNDTSISNSILINGKLLDNITVIKMENLEEEFYNFLTENSIETDKKLPHHNKNPKYKWEEYYTPRLKEIVYNWDRFVFDNFYPDLSKGV